MSKILTKTGIFLALFFLVLELTYINAKSLLYLVDGSGNIDKVFSIIGAIAFSMVTVLVLRSTRKNWMRFIFPTFDALLVFCGFNLKFGIDQIGNSIAFYLTIFMAVFTGFIMYSLNLIGSNKKEDGVELQQTKIELQQIAAKLQQSESELQQTRNKLHHFEIEQKQITAACTCEYCGKAFSSEASKRSHIGKCPEKMNALIKSKN